MSKKQDREPENEVISKDAALGALRNSGYVLESRIEKLLREDGFDVHTNFSVPDPHTGKGRESDLMAIKTAFLVDQNTNDNAGAVATIVLVECINNPQPILFLPKEPQDRDDLYDEVKCLGLPVQIHQETRPTEFTYLPRFLGVGEYHHYFKGKIATQWCSFTKKKDDTWMASHSKGTDKSNPEGEFDSLIKLNMAFEFTKSQLHDCERLPNNAMILPYFIHPVLVVQGPLWECDPMDPTLSIIDSSHVKFAHGTFLNHKESDLLIDVVTEAFLPQYLNLLNAELRMHVERTALHFQAVRDSVALATGQIRIDEARRKKLWLAEDDVND